MSRGLGDVYKRQADEYLSEKRSAERLGTPLIRIYPIIKIIASAVIKVLIIIRINAINDSGLLAYCFNLFIAYPPFYAQPKKSKDL